MSEYNNVCSRGVNILIYVSLKIYLYRAGKMVFGRILENKLFLGGYEENQVGKNETQIVK